MGEARVRKHCGFKFKQTVMKHAEENNNGNAARKYSVSETSIWGQLLLTIFTSKLSLLFEGGFCLRKFGILRATGTVQKAVDASF